MITLLLAFAVVSPSMAADLKDDLLAMEKGSWKAYGERDVKTYTDTMTEDAVQVTSAGDVWKGRDKIKAEVGSHTCTLKSFDLADANVRQPSPDTAILTYTATQDMTCEGQKSPAKVFATAIYVRQEGKWRWANYQETPLD
jgi:uncharacterized protein (TIGR02246 family)